mgnify:CR=1 FL=1
MDDKVGMPSSLNAINYATWKTCMEDIFYVKDLYEPILRENIPSGVVAKEWEILNRKAVGTIRQFVGLSVFQHIANEHNAFY